MLMHADGKLALITGSTTGIAEAFAARGCTIVLIGFGNPEEIDALRRRLARTHGVQARCDGADMSNGRRSR
jgi:3-hydroxybutyrate dehydrogenase